LLALCVSLALSWRSPRLGRDAGPDTRLGLCDLGDCPVLVGRDAVPEPGQKLDRWHRYFVRWPRASL